MSSRELTERYLPAKVKFGGRGDPAMLAMNALYNSSFEGEGDIEDCMAELGLVGSMDSERIVNADAAVSEEWFDSASSTKESCVVGVAGMDPG